MDKDMIFFLGMVIGITLCTLITIAVDKPIKEPTAMDVYQGKTTLKITYQDSVAIDSVVVFKNNK